MVTTINRDGQATITHEEFIPSTRVDYEIDNIMVTSDRRYVDIMLQSTDIKTQMLKSVDSLTFTIKDISDEIQQEISSTPSPQPKPCGCS